MTIVVELLVVIGIIFGQPWWGGAIGGVAWGRTIGRGMAI